MILAPRRAMSRYEESQTLSIDDSGPAEADRCGGDQREVAEQPVVHQRVGGRMMQERAQVHHRGAQKAANRHDS